LIRQLFEAFRHGDKEEAVALFAEDAVFRYPGPGPRHGDHRGREGILHYWAERDRLSGASSAPSHWIWWRVIRTSISWSR